MNFYKHHLIMARLNRLSITEISKIWKTGKWTLGLCFLSAVPFALAATAETPTKKTSVVKDRDQPISIDAETGTFDDQRKIQTLERNVVIRQGTLDIRADKGVVEQLSGGAQKLTLWGSPVRFKQKRENTEEWIEGSALRAEYRADSEKLELFEKAWLKTDRNEIQSAYIVYNLRTNFAEAKGGATGGPDNGKVRITIQPPKPTEPSTNEPVNPAADSTSKESSALGGL